MLLICNMLAEKIRLPIILCYDVVRLVVCMLNYIYILVLIVSIPIIWELQIVLAMCYLTSLLCILWTYAC